MFIYLTISHMFLFMSSGILEKTAFYQRSVPRQCLAASGEFEMKNWVILKVFFTWSSY